MYSGHLMDEIIQMVARAESHAQQVTVAPEPETPVVHYCAPHFLYEGSNQQVLVGVA